MAQVNYLGLESHPDHATAMKQMKHAGAMLSFELKGGYDAGLQFINNLRMCTNRYRWAQRTLWCAMRHLLRHLGVDREQRLKFGITDGLIRMSVGIENVEDIINDLEQAIV